MKDQSRRTVSVRAAAPWVSMSVVLGTPSAYASSLITAAFALLLSGGTVTRTVRRLPGVARRDRAALFMA